MEQTSDRDDLYVEYITQIIVYLIFLRPIQLALSQIVWIGPGRPDPLALFNKRGDAKAAVRELELAYSLDETDSRVLMELDQLYKKCGRGVKVRLAFLEEHMEQTSASHCFLSYQRLPR